MTIPKIIIQTWKTKTANHLISNLVKKIQTTLHDFEYLFFDDAEVDAFVKEKFPEYFDFFNSLEHRIEQIDFFRYLAVYHYGGFYMDIDMEITDNCPLNELCQYDSVFTIEHECGDKLLTNLGQTELVANYMFGASKGNEFLKFLIDQIVKGISNHITENMKPQYNSFTKIFYTAGPVAVTYSYALYPSKNQIKVFQLPDRFNRYALHKYFGTWKIDWFQKRHPGVDYNEIRKQLSNKLKKT